MTVSTQGLERKSGLRAMRAAIELVSSMRFSISHMRLMKGLRGTVAAWWALAGLAVTPFAFSGVKLFLSGLHSYGTL